MSNKYSSYVVPTEQPRWPSGIRGGAGADGGIGGEHRPEPGSASPDPASPQASLQPPQPLPHLFRSHPEHHHPPRWAQAAVRQQVLWQGLQRPRQHARLAPAVCKLQVVLQTVPVLFPHLFERHLVEQGFAPTQQLQILGPDCDALLGMQLARQVGLVLLDLGLGRGAEIRLHEPGQERAFRLVFRAWGQV